VTFYKLRQQLLGMLGAQCLMCSEPGHADNICKDCLRALPRIESACYYCAYPIKTSVCGKCILHRPNYRLIAPFQYIHPVDRLIYQLKFKPSLKHAKLFGELFSKILSQYYEHRSFPEVIIPIPLSKQRFRERGFNQSMEIARTVSKHFGIPIDSRTCSRIRHTKAQSKLDFKNRRENIKNAFKVGKNRYRHIAILDDVVTTGFTITEAANTCLDSGISQIDVWSIARVVS